MYIYINIYIYIYVNIYSYFLHIHVFSKKYKSIYGASHEFQKISNTFGGPGPGPKPWGSTIFQGAADIWSFPKMSELPPDAP